MLRNYNFLSVAILSLVLVSFTAAAGKPVAISKADGQNSLEIGLSVSVGEHKIMRNQDNSATVNPAFAKTSRPCPPFCIQPMQLRPGIETLGEQEIIHYAVMMSKGEIRCNSRLINFLVVFVLSVGTMNYLLRISKSTLVVEKYIVGTR